MHRKPKPSQREESKPARTGTRHAPGSARERVVRVFVSSTFRDMQAERDELVKRVFPQLRKLCERRGVSWGEVDLRWGITDEQRAEGRVLPICLEEIRRCRPFFIGLLGERYGSVPDAIDPELAGREPWLKGQEGTSVTELEILHGVLNAPETAQQSFFYLREPGYVESLPQDQQPAFREAREGADQRREKLATLKARIRSSGRPVRDYASPQAAGALILNDLTSVIDRLYPAGSEPDPLQREAAEHEAFARSRTGVYIGSAAYFEALDAHATGGGPPLVVLGESGSGKSALLANWALSYRDAHPDHAVVMHFIGSSPQSADWAGMLRRVMAELGRRFGIDATIPDTAEELRAAFANWLHMAAARGRVILLLDALNQLEDRDGAPDLVWLPPQIPAGVRLIVSTLPGRPLEELGRRRWPMLEVEPLALAQREELTGEYLRQYDKELSRPQAQQIVRARQCANPLFLRVLLEELRLWGEHQTLGERIGHYLAASTISALYQLVLGRWEADYERDRPGMVGEAMSLLWAARQGLSEAELLDLLGADGQPLPAAYWSPFSLAAEESLGRRAGLIGFAHDYLRQAVQNRYLSTEGQQQAAHLRLADYFDSRRDQPRGVIELPWQLAKARAWTALSDLLADPGFFSGAWEASQFDVQGYWAQIEAGSPLRMAEVYRPVIDQPEAGGKHALEVGQLLRGAGHLDATLTLNGHLASHYRALGNKVGLSSCLGNQGLILSDRGQLDDAIALLKEQEQISREFGDRHGLQLCLGNQGNILALRGDLDAAMTLHKEEEEICGQLGDRTGVQRSLGNQGVILYRRGDLDGAMALYKAQERICRELGDQAGLAASLGNQGPILDDHGDHEAAMALCKEQERICWELGDQTGLANSLGNQGLILYRRGDLDAAMALYKVQERICRELGDKHSLQVCLGNWGVALKASGDLDGAMALYKEQERICQELGDKHSLQLCLGNQGNILLGRRDLDGAMALYKEQERICRELGDKAGLQVCLGHQGSILMARRDLGAMALHKEREQICRELGMVHGLAESLANQASLLLVMHRPREALHSAEQAYALASRNGLTALARQFEPLLAAIRSQMK